MNKVNKTGWARAEHLQCTHSLSVLQET